MLEKCLRRFFFSGLEQKQVQREAMHNRIVKLTNRIEQQMSDYDMLLNGIDTMVWMNPTPETQGRSNQAVLDFFGTTQEELEGSHLKNLLPQEEAEFCIETNKEVFETGKPKTTFEWATRADGERRLLKITKKLKVNGNSYIIASAEDVTELEEARKKFQNECHFNEDVLNTAQALIIVLDTEAKIIRCNQYFESVTGYSFEEIDRKNWFDLFIKPEDRKRLKQVFESHLKYKDRSEFKNKSVKNHIIIKSGAEILVEWFSTALSDSLNQVIGVVLIGQDINDKRVGVV